MRYGAHSLMFTPGFGEADLPLFDRLKRLGLDGLEIHLDNLERIPVKGVKAKMEETGLKTTFTAVLDEPHNVISNDPKLRQAGIDYLRRRMDLVASLGGDVLGGVNYAAWGWFTGAQRTRDQWELCKESLRQVAEHGKQVGVVLAVEPVNRYETFFLNTIADARQLVEEIGHPNVRIHLDTYHVNIEEKSFYQAIKTAGEYLYHVHVCENDRGVPGTGHVQWEEVFRAFREIGYNRWCVVESFVPDVPDVARMTAIWRQVAPSADAIVTGGLQLFRRLERG